MAESYRGIEHENFTCIFNSTNRCSNIYSNRFVDDLDGLLSGGVLMEIINRKDAISQGLKHYFTGVPCRRGGIAKRFVSNGVCQCDDCLNVKKVIDVRSNIANFDKNREKLNTYKRENWDEYSSSRREYYLNNKDQAKESRLKYDSKNQDKVLQWRLNREETKSNASVAWSRDLTEFVLLEARRLRDLRKKTTGFKWSIDHMIPYINDDVCGLNVWNNIQVIPLSVNTHKRNKLIYINQHEWWSDFNKFFNHLSNKTS